MARSLILLGSVVLAVAVVVVLHEAGRYAFARLAKLPIERAWLRVFVRLGARERLGAHLGALGAGTVVAYLGVVALALGFATCHGIPTGERFTSVDAVLDGFDAVGKLQPGDRIVAIDGEPFGPDVPPPLTARVTAKQGAPVTLTVRRADELLDVTIQPKQQEVNGRMTWLLGLRQRLDRENATDAVTAAKLALLLPAAMAYRFVSDELGVLFSSDADDDPGGPVRITEEFRAAFEPVGQIAWHLALHAATYALLALVILDLVRAAALAFGRRRA